MQKLINKFYLVGIKGTGMSSLAKVLKNSGNEVIGSDVKNYYFTENSLKENDIKILEFSEENITEDYFYIIGNAYNIDNVEVNMIITKHLRFMYYHEFIGKMLNKKIIACSGTHGKTTTSYLLTQFLDKKCNYIIGDGEGGSFNNELLVLEACEYKEHFLSYKPELLIITNIELDHTDYYRNIEQLINAFQKIADNSKMVLVNGDNKNTKKIKHKNIIKYGFKKNNDVRIKILSSTKKGYYIQLNYHENYYLKIPYLGKHMIYNYVSAYLATLLLDKTPKNLNSENLPKKRLTKEIFNKSILIDDYAHHPTEIKALYESVRLLFPGLTLNVIFQPHTYERTLTFSNKFIKVLKKYDNVYIMNVFTSKREKVNHELQNKVDKKFKCFLKYSDDFIKNIGKEEGVWIFLGAGEASNLIKKIKNENN